MDKVYLRSLFENNRGFLLRLYRNDDIAKLLSNVATDKQLDCVLRILHLIGIKEIHLNSEFKEALTSNKKFNQISQFKSKQLNDMIHASREKKLKYLKQFNSLYPKLLYCMFNEV